MNKTCGFWLSVLLAFSLILAAAGEAQAARLGGGKSFGGRPSYSSPYSRPSTTPGQASPAQQPAYQQPATTAARPPMGNRSGLAGMLGGLALGGLLGAMFFGGGFQGINLLDILIFAGLAFLLFKLLARRQGGAAQPAGGRGYAEDYSREAATVGGIGAQRAGFDTDLLSKRGQAAPTLPAGFDAQGFMNGAKAAYAQLQQAWDRGDLAGLRGLCGDAVFAELQEQIRQRAGANHTEILKLEAELLEVRDIGNERVATVLFDVVLREAPGQAPTPVREVWHFTRARSSTQPTWFLDGIQQLED